MKVLAKFCKCNDTNVGLEFYYSDFSHVPSVAIADVIVVWKTLTWERKDLFWWHEEDVL